MMGYEDEGQMPDHGSLLVTHCLYGTQLIFCERISLACCCSWLVAAIMSARDQEQSQNRAKRDGLDEAEPFCISGFRLLLTGLVVGQRRHQVLHHVGHRGHLLTTFARGNNEEGTSFHPFSTSAQKIFDNQLRRPVTLTVTRGGRTVSLYLVVKMCFGEILEPV